MTIGYSGFVNADGPSKITPPLASTTATLTSGVGIYPILLSGGSAVNYVIKDSGNVLNITPANLVVKANDFGIDDDDNLPQFTSSYSGFKNNDISTIISGPMYTVSPVFKRGRPGIYTITPFGLQLTNPLNYTINYLTGTLYVNDNYGFNVVPLLTCVEILGNGPSGYKYAAHFSYVNLNYSAVYVPLGSNNIISGPGHYSGQPPTLFLPGGGSFVIYFAGNKITWNLSTFNNNHFCQVAAVASSSSPKCNGGKTTYTVAGAESAVAVDAVPAITDTVQLLTETQDPEATVFPNPTKDFVTINIKNAVSIATQVQIVDATGKVYLTTGKLVSSHALQLDMSHYASGMYFIRILVDNEFKIYRVMRM